MQYNLQDKELNRLILRGLVAREDVWDWWWSPSPFVHKESDTIYIFRKHAGFDPYYPSLSKGYTVSELKKYHDELTWAR